MDTVKIRYIGPLTEGLYTAYLDEHRAAFDFEHHTVIEGDGFVDVPVTLARELLAQREPVPPGEPIKVGVDDAGEPLYETPMQPVFESEPGASLSAAITETETPARPRRQRPATTGALTGKGNK